MSSAIVPDDHAQVQNAINAGVDTVYVRPGTYNGWNFPHSSKTYQEVLPLGGDRTNIFISGVVVYNGHPSSAYVKDMQVNGLQANGGSDGLAENCHIVGQAFSSAAVVSYSPNGFIRVLNCSIASSASYGFRVSGGDITVEVTDPDPTNWPLEKTISAGGTTFFGGGSGGTITIIGTVYVIEYAKIARMESASSSLVLNGTIRADNGTVTNGMETDGDGTIISPNGRLVMIGEGSGSGWAVQASDPGSTLTLGTVFAGSVRHGLSSTSSGPIVILDGGSLGGSNPFGGSLGQLQHGIYSQYDGDVVVGGLEITNCIGHSSFNGAAIYCEFDSGGGTRVVVQGSTAATGCTPSRIHHCTTLSGKHGAGVYVNEAGCTVSLKNCQIDNCTATDADGGAAYCGATGTLILGEGETGCDGAGAWDIFDSGTLASGAVLIDSCVADRGGGVYVLGTCSIRNLAIQSCQALSATALTAGEGGAAIMLEGAICNIYTCLITSCLTGGSAGVVHVNGGASDIVKCNFDQNATACVYGTGTADVVVQDCIVQRTTGLAALYENGATSFQVLTSNLDGNLAGDTEGAVVGTWIALDPLYCPAQTGDESLFADYGLDSNSPSASTGSASSYGVSNPHLADHMGCAGVRCGCPCNPERNENYTCKTFDLYICWPDGKEYSVGNVIAGGFRGVHDIRNHFRGSTGMLDMRLALRRTLEVYAAIDEITARNLSLLLNTDFVNTVSGCKIPLESGRSMREYGMRMVHNYPNGEKALTIVFWGAQIVQNFALPLTTAWASTQVVVSAIDCGSDHPTEPFGYLEISEPCPAT